MPENIIKSPIVLIIDDDPEFCNLLRSLLQKNYTVTVANNGSDGYQKALQQPPDTAIIDIQMPGWDGLKTLMEFRKHPLLSNVPVMMLTADASRATVLEALETGADTYVIKTDFPKDDFRDKLDKLVARTPHVQVAAPVQTVTQKSVMQLPTDSVNEHDRTADRVLDTLDRWSDRLRGHHSQKRGQRRKVKREKLTVYVPENDQEAGEAEDNAILETWQRNVSRSGASFIYHEPIKSDEVIVCLEKDKGDCTYYQSRIVRRRQTHEGFWEFGVKFLEEVNM